MLSEGPGQMRSLDELDEAIIAAIEAEPRASYTKLAQRLGVSQGTIRNRFAYLTEHEILRIVAFKNPNLSGTNMRSFLGIELETVDYGSVTEALVALPELRYVAVSTGGYDIVALAEFETRFDMLHFISESVRQIKGIRHIDAFVLLGVLKRLGGATHSIRDVL